MQKGRVNWVQHALMSLIVFSILVVITWTGSGTDINIFLKNIVTGKAKTTSNSTVIVEAPDLSGETITQILDASPKRVFWVLPDHPLSESQEALLNAYPIQSIKDPSRIFDKQGNVISQSVSDWHPSAGYLIPIERHHGIARTLPLVNSTAPTMPSPVVSLHPAEFNNHFPTYLMDYSKESMNAPVLTRNLLSDEILLKSMVAGRDVFLVHSASLMQSTIYTPFTKDKLGWLPVQYHAIALQAYENGHYLVLPNLMLIACVVVLFALAMTVIFVYLPPKYKEQIGGGSTILFSAMTVLVFWQLNIVAPIVEICVTASGFWISVHRQFGSARKRAIVQINDRLSKEVAYLSVKTTEKDKFWDNISNLVSQSLHLEKSIFLKIDPSKRRLKEIAALNCSLNDIQEKRRDISREPYLQAVLSKQSLISSRPFFKNKSDSEVEIIAPLFKGSDILGFWALTTTEPDEERQRQLRDYIDLFSLQISSLLNIQNLTQEELGKSNAFTKRFGDEEQQLFYMAQQKLDALVSTEHVYDSLYRSMYTPTILFDVFGHVSLFNKGMAKLAKMENLRLNNVNAFEFLQQILPNESDNLKNTIRRLTLEQNETEHKYFVNINDHEYLVILSSVYKEQEFLIGKELSVQLSGLFCEFHSLQEVQSYLQIERGLYDDYVIRIKNHLSALQMGLMQIENRSEDSLISQLSFYLSEELKTAANITRRTHYFMNRIVDKDNVNAIPFNPIQMLQNILKKNQTAAKELPMWRDVSFQLDLPSFSPLGLGNPEVFSEVINAALTLLADDAVSPKRINILAKSLNRNDVDIIYLKLDSEGYGLPDEQIQKLFKQNSMLGEHTYLSELVSQLKEAKTVKMDCRIKSKVGKGYRLSMLIEGISIND